MNEKDWIKSFHHQMDLNQEDGLREEEEVGALLDPYFIISICSSNTFN